MPNKISTKKLSPQKYVTVFRTTKKQPNIKQAEPATEK